MVSPLKGGVSAQKMSISRASALDFGETAYTTALLAAGSRSHSALSFGMRFFWPICIRDGDGYP
jgi:hypothetical protein